MKKTIIKILLICLISLNINLVLAEYKHNNDDKKILTTYNKIKTYINNSSNPIFTSLKIKNKIEKIFNKNENKIINLNHYNNYIEYALHKIYLNIKKDYFTNLWKNFYNPNIIENKYIKILVLDYKITWESGKIYNDKFVINNKNLTNSKWRKYLEFFKIKPEEKIEDYLINNFLNKDWKTQCEIVQYKNNFNQSKSYYFKLMKKYKSKEKYLWSTICPSKFTKWYSNNWINYFQRISPNTLMYVNAGQDYIWIDFSSIKIKK